MVKRSPAVRWWAVLLGLALVALSAVAIRDLWVHMDGNYTSWLAEIFRLVGTHTFEMWMVWAGVATILVGLVFMVVGCKKAPVTHFPVPPAQLGTEILWIRPVDIARAASATARSVPGVSSAHSQVTSSRKKGTALAVTVTGDADDAALSARVEEELSGLLTVLGSTTTLDVSVQPEPEVGSNV